MTDGPWISRPGEPTVPLAEYLREHPHGNQFEMFRAIFDQPASLGFYGAPLKLPSEAQRLAVCRGLGVPDHLAGIPTPWWRRWWQRLTRRP